MGRRLSQPADDAMARLKGSPLALVPRPVPARARLAVVVDGLTRDDEQRILDKLRQLARRGRPLVWHLEFMADHFNGVDTGARSLEDYITQRERDHHHHGKV